MEHIHRNKIIFKAKLREVISQSDRKYQIKVNGKIITVRVDPYGGFVLEVPE